MNSNRSIRPAFRRSLAGAAVAAAFAAPLPAAAQFLFSAPLYGNADMTPYATNFVEIGPGYNTEDSFKFGQWTGLTDKGAFLIGNLNYLGRDAADDRNRWQVSGSNLGLDSRGLSASYGSQGRYGLGVFYQGVPHNQFDDTRFIHTNLGGDNLGLPAGFAGIGPGGASQPPANAGAINPFLTSFDISTKRDIWGVGGNVMAFGNWTFIADYRQDQRDGNKLIGAVIGNSGGTPRAAILPYPVDDTTHQLDLAAQWATQQGQFRLGYYYSRYDNNPTSLTWRNPFATIGGWAPGVGFPAGSGSLGLSPSNDYHQINATGAWNFTRATRLSSTFSYGRMRQDDGFLPYTVNPALTAAPGFAPGLNLPRSSLEGEIKNTLFNLALVTRPMDRLSVKTSYQYQKHDNNTPVANYLYIGGDSQNQPVPGAGGGTDKYRRNVPIGSDENKLKLDVTYNIMRQTILRGFYEYKRINYEPAEEEFRSRTTNNLYGAEVRRVANEIFTGGLRYTYDERTGTDFSMNRPFGTPGAAAPTGSYLDQTFVNSSRFDNLPTLRPYHIADYDQNRIRAFGNINATDTVAFQVAADYYTIDYKGPDCGGANDQAPLTTPTAVTAARFPSECQGRTEATGQSYTIDGQWTPVPNVTAFAFYTYSTFGTDQAGRQYVGTLPLKWAQSTSAAQNWFVDQNMIDNTFGTGVRFSPADKRFDFGLQYIYNDGKTETSISSGLANSAVPDARTRLHSLQLFGKYQYSKNIAFRANYWYERFSSDDWAFDNATPTSSNNVLLTGQSSPEYTAHVVGVSMVYTGW